MSDGSSRFQVVTVTLNPAIDHTVTVSGLNVGKVNRAEQAWTNPGGKGVNVASILADYGCEVAATGFLGCENCAPYEELFTEKQIADRFVRIDGGVRMGIKIVDPARQETTDINLPGLSPTPPDMDAVHKQLGMLDAEWFVLGGSLPPGVDHSFYAEAITSLKARGCEVALDTSGEPLRLSIEAGPHIIKPNIHELKGLTGTSLATDADVLKAARSLNARGIKLVVVSLGREGACFVTTESIVIARPPAVEAKSTVGAGDAMVAGIVAAQLAGLPLRECAQLATAFSLDLLTRGKSGTPRSRIQEWIDRVVVSQTSI